MAVGDVVANMASAVANNATTNIQPGSGVEWVVHNVYYEGAVEFYIVNGANTIKIDNDTSSGARLGAVFHLNNTQYLQIKNVSGGSIDIAYDGIQTK